MKETLSHLLQNSAIPLILQKVSRFKPDTTTYEYTQRQQRAQPKVVPVSKGRLVVNWLTTTDHKTIGYLYLITSFVFFSLAGVMALLIRTELFSPGKIGRASCRE